jgi:hypothetical protein
MQEMRFERLRGLDPEPAMVNTALLRGSAVRKDLAEQPGRVARRYCIPMTKLLMTGLIVATMAITATACTKSAEEPAAKAAEPAKTEAPAASAPAEMAPEAPAPQVEPAPQT